MVRQYAPIAAARQTLGPLWARARARRYHAGMEQAAIRPAGPARTGPARTGARRHGPRPPVQVAPSLLSADFGHLARALATVEQAPADLVHLDVMDGSFVGEITFGAKLIADLRPRSTLPFDVHLMVREPARHVERFAAAGADLITVHLEACRVAGNDARPLLRTIRAGGARAGIAISPPTPAAALEPLLDVIDLALVMTVHPGAGGQPLIPSCLDKARALADRRDRSGQAFLISADGGLHRGNLPAAAAAGIDIAVIGSAIWRAPIPAEEIRAIRALLAAGVLAAGRPAGGGGA